MSKSLGGIALHFKKQSLSFLITLVFLSNLLSIKGASSNVCQIPEGTYVGLALGEGNEKQPLFVVVANKRIAGFFAPENQLKPSGTVFNQTSLDDTYSFSLRETKKGNFLDLFPAGSAGSGNPIGKAKFLESKGEYSMSGYYIPQGEEGGAGSPDDFVNIAKDGGAVAKVTAFGGTYFFFGSLLTGSFDQIFPEKERGPTLTVTPESDGKTQVNLSSSDGTEFTFRRYTLISSESCSPSDVPEGTPTPSGEAAKSNTVKFLKAIAEFNRTSKALAKAAQETRQSVKDIRRATGRIKRLVKGSGDCYKELIDELEELGTIIRDLENKRCSKVTDVVSVIQCIPDSVIDEYFPKLKDSLSTANSFYNTDANKNGVPDPCG